MAVRLAYGALLWYNDHRVRRYRLANDPLGIFRNDLYEELNDQSIECREEAG